MKNLENLAALHEESFKIDPAADGRVLFSGVIAMRDPSMVVGKYLRKVHDAAMADRVEELLVDVTALEFMNSSAIRVFIDWSEWLNTASAPYRLHYITNSRATWQRSTFGALRSLSPGHVIVEARMSA